ncbi:MAG: hypothetical protein K2Y17_08075 [Qipengyuania sp.]|nr:hypothetical protein [Qipengyuania sp.]
MSKLQMFLKRSPGAWRAGCAIERGIATRASAAPNNRPAFIAAVKKFSPPWCN